MEKHLTIKHLSPYLPYGLRIDWHNENSDWGLMVPEKSNGFERLNILDIVERGAKPILRPLSDLTNKINHNGLELVPASQLGELILDHQKELDKPVVSFADINRGLVSSNKLFNKLLEWHFDVFSLIDKGLAIDINKCNN